MVHTFSANGVNIVVDTYSGGIHILDDVAYSLVQYIKQKHASGEKMSSEALKQEVFSEFSSQYDSTVLEEAWEEIRQLYAQEVLFTEDPFSNLALNLQDRKTYVKALCLNVAHTCNLDCDYCFASQGKYHGERALMSWEVAKKSIDFLIEASGPHRNLDIDFFGGEPMLNWKVVKQTVDYARSLEEKYNKNFRFTFTTNGMLLDEEVGEYLNREMHNVVLSLDGRPEIHDRLRHTIQGEGSYARIVPRFQSFVASRGDMEYYIRGTFTKNNVDFTNDVIHMANLGFYRLSMEPVIGNPDEPYALTSEDLPELKKQYDKLADEMIRRNRLAADIEAAGYSVDILPPSEHPFLFYHFMLDLEGGPCIHKRISGCGSGTEYLAVTPWGELFPCHQFVGDAPYSVGTLDIGISNDGLISKFKQCNCYSHPECEHCWAKLYCSGGCSANALHASGSLTGTVPFSCELFRKRMECAIRIQVDRLLYEPNPEHADPWIAKTSTESTEKPS